MVNILSVAKVNKSGKMETTLLGVHRQEVLLFFLLQHLELCEDSFESPFSLENFKFESQHELPPQAFICNGAINKPICKRSR